MTPELRGWLKTEIDLRQRSLYEREGSHCAECGAHHGNLTVGCKRCRDRWSRWLRNGSMRYEPAEIAQVLAESKEKSAQDVAWRNRERYEYARARR